MGNPLDHFMIWYSEISSSDSPSQSKVLIPIFRMHYFKVDKAAKKVLLPVPEGLLKFYRKINHAH